MIKLKLIALKLKIQLKNVFESKKLFLATFLISYIGALIIGALGALLSPSCNLNEDVYFFAPCAENLKLSVYLLLNASEVLAPTTITFSGTILLLQSDKKSVMRSTLLWLIMLALVGLSFCLQQFSNQKALMLVAIVIVVLSILSVLIAWLVCEISQIESVHKREISDGKMSA